MMILMIEGFDPTPIVWSTENEALAEPHDLLDSY